MFKALKGVMVTISFLVMSNFSKEFIIKTNASKSRLGAILMQVRRHMAYLSKILSPWNKEKSIYEHELMMIVMELLK